MAEKIEKIIVLSVKTDPSNANNGIIRAFTKYGIKSFYAKGIFKQESKNRPNLLEGSITEIEYFQARLNNKMNLLKKANLVIEPNFSDYFIVEFVRKAILFLENITNDYNNIFYAYELCLNKQYEDKNFYLLTYLIASGLKSFGIKPNTESCVECGNPGNLCNFELDQGGFLCGNHTRAQKWTKELKSYYYLFKSLDTYLQICLPQLNFKIYNALIKHYINNGIFVNWEY